VRARAMRAGVEVLPARGAGAHVRCNRIEARASTGRRRPEIPTPLVRMYWRVGGKGVGGCWSVYPALYAPFSRHAQFLKNVEPKHEFKLAQRNSPAAVGTNADWITSTWLGWMACCFFST
jgi:hypothetical protein